MGKEAVGLDEILGFCHEVKNRATALAAHSDLLLEPPLAVVTKHGEALQRLRKSLETSSPAKEHLIAEVNALVDGYATILESLQEVATISTLLLDHGRELLAQTSGSTLARDPSVCDAALLAQACIDELRGAFKKHGVAVTKDLAADCFINVVSQHIHIALCNVVLNAVEAMVEHSSANRKVALRLSGNANEVCFEVVDSGPGIPPNLVDHIFDRGYTTKSYGTGLGLYLTRHFVEMYGGHIKATNQAGTGASISLWFPRTGSTP